MINFELPAIRPPSESRSLLLKATKNCPWNRCAFCYGSPYGREKFQLRPVDEIKQDILSMRELSENIRDWCVAQGFANQIEQVATQNGIYWLTGAGVRTAFIGDANSLIMKTNDLVEVIEFLYQSFPTLERVTSYARAHTVLKKKESELELLHQAGLSRLHLGLETGDDELLKYIDKGSTSEDMINAGIRVKESGITLSEYVILGLGGQERWRQHAQGTARVLNAIDPDYIRIRTLVVRPRTALYDKVEQGEFEPLSAEQILHEERLLIELLQVNSEFVSDHVSNYLSVEGKLPGAKWEMLKSLDSALNISPELRSTVLQAEEMRRL